MAASSSGSSFTSSSLSRPPTYSRSYVSPVDSTWTHTSGISTISDPSTGGSVGQARPLDLGPPGFTATITLYPETADERTVYLGPWEICSEPRRIVWQCSYQNEFLEHYLPSDIPSEIHPHTLHSRHRQFHDPSDMERYLTFNDCHRVRYITDEGICIHDDFISVRYEFTTVAASVQFQSDVRQKQLVGFYDIDVVWTDKQSRTDSFGKVKGVGAIQRLKLWRDNYTMFHSLSVLANKTDQQYREYEVQVFDGELKREERQRQTRLNVNTRRSSATDEHDQPRVSLAQRIRPRVRSTGQASRTRPELGPSPRTANIDIRYLHFQFTNKEGYHQFLADWIRAHSSDRNYHHIPFPSSHSDLPQPALVPSALISTSPPTTATGCTEGQG